MTDPFTPRQSVVAVKARHVFCWVLLWLNSEQSGPQKQAVGTWHSADNVLDAEEDFDDDLGDGSHDYADLAAAMGSPEEEVDSDEEGNEGSGSELGVGDHVMPSNGEEEDVDWGDDDSAGSGSGGISGSDLDDSDQEVDDELNPFELAEATDSEDEPKRAGKFVEAGPAGTLHKCMCLNVLVCLLNHALLAKAVATTSISIRLRQGSC